MHIHILGICGTFMGGIAVLAKSAGFKVTGCDFNVYPPMSTQLTEQGIELIEGFSPDQTKLNPDIYVIGNVVSRGNPLMEAILDQGLPYISGPQWLAENILHQKWILAVAGTHGKTTTSSMLAWVLEYAGLAPGFLIGGVPQNFGVSARLPLSPSTDQKSQSPFFVIEADEYDTAFFDKRSKFVHYRPRTLVLNNLEFDHADIFENLYAIETQFHHLVRTVPGTGRIIMNDTVDALKNVISRGCWSEIEHFGTEQGWHSFYSQDQTGFDVFYKTEKQGHVSWELLGEHNRMNALAVIAAARHVGVPVEISMEALQHFQNVKRRMEVRAIVNEITVYDDFAHHPTAIATTISGLREKIGHARILAVLEPRSNTMKLGVMKQVLAESLGGADKVFCYSNNLGWDAKAVLDPIIDRSIISDDLEQLISFIVNEARPLDHIVIMSNGSFGGIHQKLIESLGD